MSESEETAILCNEKTLVEKLLVLYALPVFRQHEALEVKSNCEEMKRQSPTLKTWEVRVTAAEMLLPIPSKRKPEKGVKHHIGANPALKK